MNAIETKVFTTLKSEVLHFMFDCKEANIIFCSNKNNCEIKCLAKLTNAIGHLSFAKSVYLFSIDDKRDDIDNVLYQCDVFIKEITDSIATNHSPQWTNIEFSKLAKMFDDSVLADKSYFSDEY